VVVALLVPAAACEDEWGWSCDGCTDDKPRGDIERFVVVQPVDGAQITGTVMCEFDVATDRTDARDAVVVTIGIARETGVRQWTPGQGPVDCTPMGSAREVFYIFEAQSTLTGDRQQAPDSRVFWQP
jgi:hypothetical protein